MALKRPGRPRQCRRQQLLQEPRCIFEAVAADHDDAVGKTEPIAAYVET
jgi:hypothetical protein